MFFYWFLYLSFGIEAVLFKFKSLEVFKGSELIYLREIEKE